MEQRPGVVDVRIAQVKVGRSPDILRATLGSCVGIAFLWPRENLYGLAHCLLPQAPEGARKQGARYVNQAFSALMELMEIPKNKLRYIEVHLAGGAYMFQGTAVEKEAGPNVGNLNAQMALEMAKKMRLNVKSMDFGGRQARRMIVHCEMAQVEVEVIPSMSRLED